MNSILLEMLDPRGAQKTVELLEKVTETLQSGTPLSSFVITEKQVKELVKQLLLQTLEITEALLDIEKYKAMVKMYYNELLRLKAEMCSVITNIKDLIQNAITQITAVITASSAGGFPNPTFGTASAIGIVSTVKSGLITIFSLIAEILGSFVKLGLGVPSVFLEPVNAGLEFLITITSFAQSLG